LPQEGVELTGVDLNSGLIKEATRLATAVPSTDLRSATSVFFLGPLTALRPFVMIAGVSFGIWRAQLHATIFLGLFVLLLMLSPEFALNLYNAHLQQHQIRSLL
jgi:hypothetical protein